MSALLIEAFQSYELLREEATDIPWLQAFLASNYVKGNVITVRRDGQLNGLAIAWRIEDPLDLKNGYPGESPQGKYIYFPVLYVRPEFRLNGQTCLWLSPVLKELFAQTFSSFEGIKAIVFQRSGPMRCVRRKGRRTKLQRRLRDPDRLHICRRKL